MHELTVKELVKEINRPPEVVPLPGGSNSEPVFDDGSTADEYEDATDVVMEDMFLREPTPSRLQPLMPEGSLDDAMREACHQPARDVRTRTFHYFLTILILCLIIFKRGKLLAVYLHHDGSVSSNVFCTQVLC